MEVNLRLGLRLFNFSYLDAFGFLLYGMAVPNQATDCTLSLPTAVFRRGILMRHRRLFSHGFLLVWTHGDMDLLQNAARGGSVACVPAS